MRDNHLLIRLFDEQVLISVTKQKKVSYECITLIKASQDMYNS